MSVVRSRTIHWSPRGGGFSVPRPPAWMDLAQCAETDPELFFPADNTITGPDAPVRVLCRSCEVRLDCLKFALEHFEAGIWGGFTESARKRITTRYRAGERLEDIIAEADEAYFARQEEEKAA